MRKNKVTKSILAAILIVVAVFFIAGTYARYSTQGKVDLVTDVAKWNVAIKKGDTTLTTTTQDIVFTVHNDEYTVDGKLAPNTYADATVDLYLEDTEVAVDFDAVIDSTALGSTGLNNAQLTLTTMADGQASTTYASGETITYALPNGAAFTAQNGTKHITLTLTWANSDSNNAQDTANGIAANSASEIRIPVTLTAKQHIATPEPSGD